MNINELSQSNYLKKSDVTPPIMVTISGVTHENLAQQGQPAEMKYVLQFSEAVKPMVLNATNGGIIAHITGSDESDNWIGRKITLYNDPSISFGGQLTGGIRVEVPREQAVAAPAPAQAAPVDERNPPDIPF